ncbi:hypothetical protein [Geothrix sp. PMB-07]|uniref:hypothetical protein n=1 Tax=Geothrix sp. PMB-07 TaxID=3068640 RepID=UPI002741BE29|nr:hypothetical protein [Geothrix sp. PMB-07]WLT30298.1 hypothetical protein Q9293_11270 [Geothrix sp. PMB-07]
MKLMNQRQLKEYFITIRGKKLSSEALTACLIKGMPYTIIGKRKHFNPISVVDWLEKQETVSKYYITNKSRQIRRG